MAKAGPSSSSSLSRMNVPSSSSGIQFNPSFSSSSSSSSSSDQMTIKSLDSVSDTPETNNQTPPIICGKKIHGFFSFYKREMAKIDEKRSTTKLIKNDTHKVNELILKIRNSLSITPHDMNALSLLLNDSNGISTSSTTAVEHWNDNLRISTKMNVEKEKLYIASLKLDVLLKEQYKIMNKNAIEEIKALSSLDVEVIKNKLENKVLELKVMFSIEKFISNSNVEIKCNGKHFKLEHVNNFNNVLLKFNQNVEVNFDIVGGHLLKNINVYRSEYINPDRNLSDVLSICKQLNAILKEYVTVHSELIRDYNEIRTEKENNDINEMNEIMNAELEEASTVLFEISVKVMHRSSERANALKVESEKILKLLRSKVKIREQVKINHDNYAKALEVYIELMPENPNENKDEGTRELKDLIKCRDDRLLEMNKLKSDCDLLFSFHDRDDFINSDYKYKVFSVDNEKLTLHGKRKNRVGKNYISGEIKHKMPTYEDKDHERRCLLREKYRLAEDKQINENKV